jgi:DMSO/TMAO reductase YedYZ molybdopterin-dependent catalytic subunit
VPEAIAFSSLRGGPEGGLYYDAHPIEQMRHRLTMLAHDMNGAPLSYGQGAPLRLRNEAQLGFKQVKWIAGRELVAGFSEVGGGHGGCNQDHEFFGYRQTIWPKRPLMGFASASATNPAWKKNCGRWRTRTAFACPQPIANTAPNWQFCAANRGDLAILKGATNRRFGAFPGAACGSALRRAVTTGDGQGLMVVT